MDWIKYPFIATYHLHDSPEAPSVRVLWYPTDLPGLDLETLVNCRIWDSDDLTDLPIGQTWPIERDYSNVWGITGLTGEHHCGEDSDFEDGQPWPYDGPPIEYDRDHIPLCCPRDRGKDVTAGASVDTGLEPGYAIAPTAGASVDYLITPPTVYTVTAGASVDTGLDHGYAIAPTAGASVDYLGPPPPPHDVTAGASVDTSPAVHGPTAGASADYTIPPPTFFDVTAGASMDVLLGHATCATAEDFDAGTTIETGFSAVNEVHWYFTTLEPGVDYYFDFVRAVDPGSINVWQGGCADLLSLIGGYDFGDSGHHLFTAPEDGRVWVQVTAFGVPEYTWSIYLA